MELGEAFAGRRSVRSFTDQVPDEASVRRLVRAAVQAPSARNRQPWRFTVVRDRDLLDTLNERAKAFRLASVLPGEDDLRASLMDPRTHLLHHAPALVLISAAETGRWNFPDCALAAQNLMLAAYAAGLGTCWIGMVQGYLASPEGKALLALPEEFVPVAPIVLGYPAEQPAPVERDEPVISWIG